jgi:hypothetical protein
MVRNFAGHMVDALRLRPAFAQIIRSNEKEIGAAFAGHRIGGEQTLRAAGHNLETFGGLAAVESLGLLFEHHHGRGRHGGEKQSGNKKKKAFHG